MAYQIEDIIYVLREEKIAPEILVKIETKLEQIAEEKKEERGSGPRQKNQFVIVVRGDEDLKKTLQQGWVVQVPYSGFDVQALPEIMRAAAKDNNNSQKRRKKPVTTWRDFFQYVKRPFVKNRNINIKSKEPVQVVILDTENL